MAFRSTLRLEEIYFNNLRRLIEKLKAWKDGETSEELGTILDSCIESNSAILLLYKNLGEEWNELTAILKESEKKIEELRESVTAYQDELNEKIDAVNNIINATVTDLETTVTSVEARVQDLESRVEDIEAEFPIPIPVEVFYLTQDEEHYQRIADNTGYYMSFYDMNNLMVEGRIPVIVEQIDSDGDTTTNVYLPVKSDYVMIGENVRAIVWENVEWSGVSDNTITQDVIIMTINNFVDRNGSTVFGYSTPEAKEDVFTSSPSDALGSTTNLNIVPAGVYFCPTTVQGLPVNGEGFIMTLHYLTRRVQFFIPCGSGYLGYVYTRRFLTASSTWGSWYRISGTQI